MPHADDGQTIEPSVSDPMATAHRLAATAAPDPELEPHGLRSMAYGLRHWPPRALHPDSDRLERKLAHSDRLALPRNTAPAARRRAATPESFSRIEPVRASEPAVVVMRSAVPTLSLSRIGMPWSGPRGPRARRSRSSLSASARASGLISMTERSAGPRLSSASMRARYASAISFALCSPDAIAADSVAMVASSIHACGASAAGGSGGAACGAGLADGPGAARPPGLHPKGASAIAAPAAAQPRNCLRSSRSVLMGPSLFAGLDSRTLRRRLCISCIDRCRPRSAQRAAIAPPAAHMDGGTGAAA